MKKSILLGTFAVLLTFGFTGCDDGNNNTNNTPALSGNVLTVTGIPQGTTLVGAGVNNAQDITIATALAGGTVTSRVFTFYVPTTPEGYIPSSTAWSGTGEFALSLSGDINGKTQYVYTAGKGLPAGANEKFAFTGGSKTVGWDQFTLKDDGSGGEDVISFNAGQLAAALGQTIPAGATLDDLIGLIMPGADYESVSEMGIVFYKDEDLSEPFSGDDEITANTIIYTTSDLSSFLGGGDGEEEGNVLTITGIPEGTTIVMAVVLSDEDEELLAIAMDMSGSGVFAFFTSDMSSAWAGTGPYMLILLEGMDESAPAYIYGSDLPIPYEFTGAGDQTADWSDFIPMSDM